MDKEQFHTINNKLDVIDQKVTKEEPSWWSIWWPRIKYALIALAWLVGIITHRWGWYHRVEAWFG